MLGVIAEFGIDTSELHNDSTSVSVHGAYRDADGTPRGGKPTPAVTFGHSKDHRPDLKQLVWILTVSADGAVPIAYRLADGNTNDDPTHIPTWDELVALLGRRDFLYVADSKLCSARGDGPHRRRPAAGSSPCCRAPAARTRWFRDWIQTQPATMDRSAPAARRRGSATPTRSGRPSPPRCPRPRATGSSGSTPPARPPATPHARQARIEAGAAAIDALAARLAGPKTRLKTRAAVEAEAAAALADAGAARWISFTVSRDHRGDLPAGEARPARRRHPLPPHHPHPLHHQLATPAIDAHRLRRRQRRLLPADHQRHGTLTDAEVLAAYRYQPNLERRHHLLKSVQDAAPVWLHDPARIEALFCCQFLALLVGALIERQIRTAMTAAATDRHPALPRATRLRRALRRTHPRRSSPTSPATSSTATASTCRPSKPELTPYSSRSSTCSASPTTPTPGTEPTSVGGPKSDARSAESALQPVGLRVSPASGAAGRA